jgi:hypothetical protein
MKTLTFRFAGLLLVAAALTSSFMVARPAHATICYCPAGPSGLQSPVFWGMGATCLAAASDLGNQETAYGNSICGVGQWCGRTNFVTHTCAYAGDTQDGYMKFKCKENC